MKKIKKIPGLLMLTIFAISLSSCTEDTSKYYLKYESDMEICRNVDLQTTTARAVTAVISLGFTELIRDTEKKEAYLKEYQQRNLGNCTEAGIVKAYCNNKVYPGVHHIDRELKHSAAYKQCVINKHRLIQNKEHVRIAKKYSLFNKSDFDVCWGSNNSLNNEMYGGHMREARSRGLGDCNASDLAKVDCKNIYADVNTKGYKQCVLNTTYSIENKIRTKKLEIATKQAAADAKAAKRAAKRAARDARDARDAQQRTCFDYDTSSFKRC